MRFGLDAQSLEVFHIFLSVEIFVIAPAGCSTAKSTDPVADDK
jgi:hypothetical protein